MTVGNDFQESLTLNFFMLILYLLHQQLSVRKPEFFYGKKVRFTTHNPDNFKKKIIHNKIYFA